MTRAWIIGNGESLGKTPLDKLAGEVTFSTGRINLLLKEIDWRPTNYVLAEEAGVRDEPRIRRDLREIALKVNACYFQAGLIGLTQVPHPNCLFEFFTTCQHANTGPPETWHLPELCAYGSSVHVALQIATLQGYSPLYLLGCDLVGGHFADNYGESLVQTNLWRHAHEIAHRSNPEIYNATIGGDLEAYTRVEMEDVLCQRHLRPTAL